MLLPGWAIGWGFVRRAAFCLPPVTTKSETQTLASLQRACNRYDVLTDELYVMDVFHVSDDTRYFVFEVSVRY